ncbi:MAG: hypothetical protein ABIJ09_20155 [Pseudomonadota bacterium]
MPVKVICAWCKRDLSPEIQDYSPRDVSHTMCDPCLSKNLEQDPISIREFLDGQPYPILLVNGAGAVLSGNDKAENKLGKSLGDMQGVLGGDVVACVNAGDEGGCGHTLNCAMCEFRNAFEHTHKTGKALVDKPVSLTVLSATGARLALSLKLSTRKIGAAVFITIHALQTRPAIG